MPLPFIPEYVGYKDDSPPWNDPMDAAKTASENTGSESQQQSGDTSFLSVKGVLGTVLTGVGAALAGGPGAAVAALLGGTGLLDELQGDRAHSRAIENREDVQAHEMEILQAQISGRSTATPAGMNAMFSYMETLGDAGAWQDVYKVQQGMSKLPGLEWVKNIDPQAFVHGRQQQSSSKTFSSRLDAAMELYANGHMDAANGMMPELKNMLPPMSQTILDSDEGVELWNLMIAARTPPTIITSITEQLGMLRMTDPTSYGEAVEYFKRNIATHAQQVYSDTAYRLKASLDTIPDDLDPLTKMILTLGPRYLGDMGLMVQEPGVVNLMSALVGAALENIQGGGKGGTTSAATGEVSVSPSPDAWLENAYKENAKLAREEIVRALSQVLAPYIDDNVMKPEMLRKRDTFDLIVKKADQVTDMNLKEVNEDVLMALMLEALGSK